MKSAPRSSEFIAQQLERSAQSFAREVRQWLCSFEASDADRKLVINDAGLLLDQAPLDSDGTYLIDNIRAVTEILAIWRPKTSHSADRDFVTVVSPWLAVWIRFWITDPNICNRALDLEYAHFGAKAQTAA